MPKINGASQIATGSITENALHPDILSKLGGGATQSAELDYLKAMYSQLQQFVYRPIAERVETLTQETLDGLTVPIPVNYLIGVTLNGLLLNKADYTCIQDPNDTSLFFTDSVRVNVGDTVTLLYK